MECTISRRHSAGRHYLSVGLSAIRCIDAALEKSNGDCEIQSILDLPSGYGRVLRFLRVRFPRAEITASEMYPEMLEFCRKTFAARIFQSDMDFDKLAFAAKFDLIWCGSLITHINERGAVGVLRFFRNHLAPGGVCIVTTHGNVPVGRLRNNAFNYGLTAEAVRQLLAGFDETGYGYADYQNQHGYGISVVSHERMSALARGAGEWHEISFLEKGWDNHQDVYSFSLSRPYR